MDPQLIDVLSAIYEAALQPDAWPAALAQIGSLVNCTWLPFGIMDCDWTPAFVTQQAGGDAEHLAFFRERFCTPETNPSLPLLASLGTGGFALSHRDLPKAVWESSGLHREVFKPAGLYHGGSTLVVSSESHKVVLGTCRPASYGPIQPSELARLRQILPHLQRAVQTFLKLSELELLKSANESLWDRLSSGVVLLDKLARIVWMNRAATACVGGAELHAVNGVLCASNRGVDDSLRRLVAGALATSDERAGGSGGLLKIPRPGGQRALELLVAPIKLRASFAHAPAAVVFINDVERHREALPEALQTFYGLTAREAELVSLLLVGASLRETAVRLGIALHTARTHLKLVLQKTGTHRQAELVSLLLRGPAGLAARSFGG